MPGRDTTESIAGSDHVNRQWQTKEPCFQAQKARTNDQLYLSIFFCFPGCMGRAGFLVLVFGSDGYRVYLDGVGGG